MKTFGEGEGEPGEQGEEKANEPNITETTELKGALAKALSAETTDLNSKISKLLDANKKVQGKLDNLISQAQYEKARADSKSCKFDFQALPKNGDSEDA